MAFSSHFVFYLILYISALVANKRVHIYVQATSFDGVFLLVAFHYIALVRNYCFFIVVNKISIYLSTKQRPDS